MGCGASSAAPVGAPVFCQALEQTTSCGASSAAPVVAPVLCQAPEEITSSEMTELLSKIQLLLSEVQTNSTALTSIQSSVDAIKAKLTQDEEVLADGAGHVTRSPESGIAPVQVQALPSRVDVFISLRVATMLPVAKQLREFCQSKGFTTWICTDIEQGGSYRRDIVTMVGRCRAFVPLIDRAWAESGECEYEFNVATRFSLVKKVPVMLPFMFEEIDMGEYPLIAGLMANTNVIFVKGKPRVAFETFSAQNSDLFSAPAPAALVATAATAQTQSTAPKRLLDSGGWVGYYIDARTGCEQWPMELYFVFKRRSFVGWGKDGVGYFELVDTVLTPNPSAESDPEGDVANIEFTKQYIGQHAIYYKGTVRNGQLIGEWAFEYGGYPGGSFVLFPDTEEN